MKRILAFVAALVLAAPLGAAEMGDDGLHKAPWQRDTFKDLAEDLDEANAEDKRLLVMVEQRGCIYCKKLHETVFSIPEVAQYIAKNFMVVQYNMFGDEEVTDIDGKTLTEKTAARKWGLAFTPTVVFLPDAVPAGKNAREAAVMVMPGAFGKSTVLHAFQWVKEKGYLGDEPFQKYHARKFNAAREKSK